MGTGSVGSFRRERWSRLVGAGAAVGWFAVAGPAVAQQQTVDDEFELEEDNVDQDVTDETAAESGEDVDLMDDEAMAADRVDDEQVLVEEQVGVESQRSGLDPFEEKNESYFFLGGFYRHTFQPEWMLNWFFEQSTASDNGGGGLEFTWRRNSFSVIVSGWYQLAKAEGRYLQKGDTIDEMEWIESDLSTVFVSATFLWATDFTDWFALEYGFGVGLGFMLGDLTRTEAYPTNALNADGTPAASPPPPRDPYLPCNDLNDPVPNSIGPQWCDGVERGDEGNISTVEKKWSQGGDVPNVFPWLALPHIALRFKPIKQIVIRVEGGFSTAGPFFGGGIAYGF